MFWRAIVAVLIHVFVGDPRGPQGLKHLADIALVEPDPLLNPSYPPKTTIPGLNRDIQPVYSLCMKGIPAFPLVVWS